MVNYYSEKSTLSINELIENNLELVKKNIFSSLYFPRYIYSCKKKLRKKKNKTTF